MRLRRLLRRTPFVLLLLAGVVSCREAKRPREFDGRQAFGYIETQVGFGPRIPGTTPHARMAEWLDSLLRLRADTVIAQQWTHVTKKGDRLPLVNFIARFNPRAGKRILYLAHWDSRPTADAPTSSDSSRPVPGANDGGSGVALLLGVADVLKRAPATDVGVDLLFVDGEDYGDFNSDTSDVLIGSRYYAGHQVTGPAPLYAVLFDLIADRELQIYQEGNSLVGSPEVVDLVWGAAKDLGYGGTFVAAPRHTLIDDHIQLQKAGIRAIDVVDFDYPSWHTIGDTIDKVSAQSLQIVGDVAVELVRREAK